MSSDLFGSEKPPNADSPDDGALTTDEVRAAIAALDARGAASDKCPVCEKNALTVARHFVVPTAFKKDGLSHAASTYPCLMVLCENCGFSRLHNIIVLGLIDRNGR